MSKKDINIRLVGMGGLFLICFDSLLLQKIQDHGNDYYGSVGTFVDLVSQTPSMSGMKLKIALVAMINTEAP